MRGLGFSNWRAFDTEKSLGWIVSGIAFLFPLTVLSVNRADSILLLLLGVIGTYAFLRHGVRELALTRRDGLMMVLFVGWYAVIVLCYFLGDRTPDGFKLLGRYLRLLFFLPALIACRRYLVRPRWLFAGLLLAPFPTLGLALWQYWHTQWWVRVGGFVDVIPFGDLGLAMGFMAFSIVLAKRGHKPLWLYMLVVFALAAGIAVSTLSGTRGGWVALPVLVVISVLGLSGGSWRRGILVLVACAVVASVAGWAAPGKFIGKRLAAASWDIHNYYEYLKLADRGDVLRQGCLDDPLALDNIAREMNRHAHGSLKIEAIHDVETLHLAGFGTCQSGVVIRLMNRNTIKQQHVSFNRIVQNPRGEQTLRFIVRGAGALAINGVGKAMVKFDSERYALVQVTRNTGNTSHAIPYISVNPGATVWFVPIQSKPGEYVYPLVNTSIGQRLEMWRVAWQIFLHHPLMGAGSGAFMKETARMVETHDISPGITRYDHPHNDYFNAMVSWGVLGLVAYLLVLGLPLKLYIGAVRTGTGDRKAAGFVGIIMISGLLIFGLTETMFTHSIVMSWYVTFTAMLTAIMLRASARVGWEKQRTAA